MNKLMILVGNVGSGKTTLTQELVKLGYNVISRDALRYMIGGGKYVFDPVTEKIIKKIALSMLRQMVQKKLDILIDATNMSVFQREEMLAIANKVNYNTIAYVLPKLSKKESINRKLLNNYGDTSKKVWDEIWDNFNNMYQEPTHEEGFDKIIYGVKK